MARSPGYVGRRAVLGYAGQVLGDIVLLVTGLLNPVMAATVVAPGRHVRNEELLKNAPSPLTVIDAKHSTFNSVGRDQHNT